MPVFLFGLAVAENMVLWKVLLSFFLLHFLLYPASNGYNSYFDKDENSIGGLKSPPKVTGDLYWISIVLDVLAIGLGVFISWTFAIMLFLYGMVSKAYSHPLVRLKKRPILGWLSVGIFQGYFTLLMTVHAVSASPMNALMDWHLQFPAILSSALLLGSYPMTQIYQHEEDQKRGDTTLSLKLGILGTFHFTAAFFLLANLGFIYYLFTMYGENTTLLFQMALTPVIVYFGIWYFLARANRIYVNHRWTMRLNLISSLMLNAFFLFLGFWDF